MDWIKPTLKCRRKWFQKTSQSVASYLAMSPGQRQGIAGPWGQLGCPKDPDNHCPCVAQVGEEWQHFSQKLIKQKILWLEMLGMNLGNGFCLRQPSICRTQMILNLPGFLSHGKHPH